MRALVIHKNIPVSDSKVTLGLRVGSIFSQLTADKHFPVNPRVITGPPKMRFLLDAQSTPALITKLRLILVVHTDDLVWYITQIQREKCSFKSSTELSADQMLRQSRCNIITS